MRLRAQRPPWGPCSRRRRRGVPVLVRFIPPPVGSGRVGVVGPRTPTDTPNTPHSTLPASVDPDSAPKGRRTDPRRTLTHPLHPHPPPQTSEIPPHPGARTENGSLRDPAEDDSYPCPVTGPSRCSGGQVGGGRGRTETGMSTTSVVAPVRLRSPPLRLFCRPPGSFLSGRVVGAVRDVHCGRSGREDRGVRGRWGRGHNRYSCV